MIVAGVGACSFGRKRSWIISYNNFFLSYQTSQQYRNLPLKTGLPLLDISVVHATCHSRDPEEPGPRRQAVYDSRRSNPLPSLLSAEKKKRLKTAGRHRSCQASRRASRADSRTGTARRSPRTRNERTDTDGRAGKATAAWGGDSASRRRGSLGAGEGDACAPGLGKRVAHHHHPIPTRCVTRSVMRAGGGGELSVRPPGPARGRQSCSLTRRDHPADTVALFFSSSFPFPPLPPVVKHAARVSYATTR